MIFKILIFTKLQVPAPVLEPLVPAPVPEPEMPAAPTVTAPEPPAAPPQEEESPAASTKHKDSFAQVCAWKLCPFIYVSPGSNLYQISLIGWIAIQVLGCDLYADQSGPQETAFIFRVFRIRIRGNFRSWIRIRI